MRLSRICIHPFIPSLQLLCTLKAVIIAVVPLLVVLQRGLCVWKKEVIPEIDYNDVVDIRLLLLYTDTLTKLRNHPLSVDLLRASHPSSPQLSPASPLQPSVPGVLENNVSRVFFAKFRPS
jgi:hypothetical protein